MHEKKKYARLKVDCEFHKKLKIEATKKGLTLKEYTKQLAMDERDTFDIFKKKKNSIW